MTGNAAGAAPGADGAEGFTLIELMISLGLFALVAVAGLAMVDGILGVQGRTEARLDRMAALQRAMFAVGNDLDQIADADVSGDAGRLSFTRAAPGLGGPVLPISYQLQDGALVRLVAGRPQLLLPGVRQVRWRYLGDQWQAAWPPAPDRQRDWPRAIEMEVELLPGQTPTGSLRRLVALPARPSRGPVQ